jgi:GntR family transcriptional regulator
MATADSRLRRPKTVQFYIQPDSEIPASKQLLDQIQFAIASRQYPPGERLPSTRQLAMITGLHRNTISKVYQQLEETGLVESQPGSGIYVKDQSAENCPNANPGLEKYPKACRLVKESLDQLLDQGCSLTQARELFLSEIDWRLRCSARVLLSVPVRDLGAGELMTEELEQALGIPIQLVPTEELAKVLEQAQSATVITSRYFTNDLQEVIIPPSVRVITVDIYDYRQELEIIQQLSQGSYLGLVSLSKGTLGVAESIVYSLRGDDLLIVTAQVSDQYKLNAIVRSAHTIICDRASYEQVKQAVNQAKDDLIRLPKVIESENYISTESITLLKRELGLD